MTLPLLIGQGLGVIPSAVITWQIVLYKILPAHGKRMNADGHFTGYYGCATCRSMYEDLYADPPRQLPFPRPCLYDGVGGLLHVSFRPGVAQQLAKCDQCQYTEHRHLRGVSTPRHVIGSHGDHDET